MRQQQALGNDRAANTFALKAMRAANVAINLPNGTNNLSGLSLDDFNSLKNASLHVNSILQESRNDISRVQSLFGHGGFGPIASGITRHFAGRALENLNEMNHFTMRVNDYDYRPRTSNLGDLANGRYDFDSINLRPTALELQEFRLSLNYSRASTFGPSGASPADVTLGGVLFRDDNDYRVDLAGRLASEVNDDLRRGRGSGGPVMGRTRYFDNIPLLWLDVAGSRNRSLPVAMPRFLTGVDADVRTNLRGVWSFEALTLDVRRSKHDGGKPLRATVTPAETQTRVSYMPLDLVHEDAPVIWGIRNGTGFEPSLEVGDRGQFVWTLRHGVQIEFDQDGLVDAIRSPHGEHIKYVREDGRLVGQQTSDGRRIDIQYDGDRPETITLDRKPRVAYEYYTDHRLQRVRGDREWSIGYDPKIGRPCRITSPNGATLSLAHDDEGRVTRVESGPISVGIEYLEGTNTLRLSSNGQPTTDWLLGPISGPVLPDRAVLLTRSIAGRILQVSKGPVQGTGETREFTPTETIELVR